MWEKHPACLRLRCGVTALVPFGFTCFSELRCSALLSNRNSPHPSALFFKGERLKMISLLLCVRDAIAPLGLGLPWEANALWQT